MLEVIALNSAVINEVLVAKLIEPKVEIIDRRVSALLLQNSFVIAG
ncbi:hypothetical protein SAMN05216534_1659 [Candidatus Aquiluna sp. UB-MaderosW2red]|nr:hypothetical protein SAMN05216534_1659 [Candidatus Aquiluna sp. UB-MaderosW2red]